LKVLQQDPSSRQQLLTTCLLHWVFSHNKQHQNLPTDNLSRELIGNQL
jgi:hypothetical protein